MGYQWSKDYQLATATLSCRAWICNLQIIQSSWGVSGLQVLWNHRRLYTLKFLSPTPTPTLQHPAPHRKLWPLRNNKWIQLQPPFPSSSERKTQKDFWFREKTTSLTLGFFSIKIEGCKSVRRKLPLGLLSRHLRSNQTSYACVKSTSHSHSLPAKSLGQCNWFRSIRCTHLLYIITARQAIWLLLTGSLVQWTRWIYKEIRKMLRNDRQSCCPPHPRIKEMRMLRVLKILQILKESG